MQLQLRHQLVLVPVSPSKTNSKCMCTKKKAGLVGLVPAKKDRSVPDFSFPLFCVHMSYCPSTPQKLTTSEQCILSTFSNISNKTHVVQHKNFHCSCEIFKSTFKLYERVISFLNRKSRIWRGNIQLSSSALSIF